MEWVFSYVELPDKVKRIVIAKNSKEARKQLLLKRKKFTDLKVDALKTLLLLLRGTPFTDKEYLTVLRTIQRYYKLGRGFREALRTASLNPDENVSLLASLMYEISLSKQRLSEILKEAGYPEYIYSVVEAAEKQDLSIGDVLPYVIDFYSSEAAVRKKMNGIASSLKRNLALIVIGFTVIAYALPPIYELGKEMHPHAQYGAVVESVVKLGYLFRENLLYPVIFALSLIGTLFYLIKGDRFYSLINRIPGLKVVETMDKKLIASYVLLSISTIEAPAITILRELIKIPKLEKFRKKLKNAYYKLRTKVHVDLGEVFEVADIDKLFVVKLKGNKETQEEELRILISDFDELLEEQMKRAEDFINASVKAVMIGLVLFIGYVFVTVYYR